MEINSASKNFQRFLVQTLLNDYSNYHFSLLFRDRRIFLVMAAYGL